MQNEIEAQFLSVDKTKIRAKLQSIGATCIKPEIKMKRVIFDAGPHRFIRVRDEGDKIVMTYKNVEDDNSILGTKEINLIVNDYDDAVLFMQETKLPIKAHQETLREIWQFQDVEICIDTWPWIPSFIEIEGPTEDAVWNVAAKLGFSKAAAKFGSVDTTYQHYYGVDCDTVNLKTPVITFECEPPEWVKPDILAKIDPTKKPA
ncbi:CYTH domain-containing protein [Candidatus Saccharibacteria bacterium]|nr:CYTH domain-containing protein [Candidatus Saccharibacteria bacterium]